MKYLLKQVEELASNRDLQPVYIQWTASADSTALLNASELHDGWYVIDDFEADYSRNVVTALVECRMTVTEIASGAPRRVALGYSGAALSTNFSGTATNLIAAPISATIQEAGFNRTAAEGSVPSVLSPVANPEPVVLSSTIANIFKGGVHVYDTINTGSNPVPSSGGTFVNANWVEVFWSDHNFSGDCVITNGLQLVILIQGAAHVASLYLWNTATATANWQKYADLNYQDVAANIGTLQGYTLRRIGPEECSVETLSSTSGGKNATIRLRLQRGRYEVRTDFIPNVEASTSATALSLVVVATPKILYNSTKIADNVLSETSPTITTDYGYGACFVANASQAFVTGFLYQNEPTGSQPSSAGNVATIGSGDTASLAAAAQRAYGVFAIPYGVNASYSTANLQAEAESGTLGTGWTSQANAAASAGNEAKCASGTATTNADLWGTAFVPDPGTYDLWVRLKVTSAASSTVQMQIGLWNSTDSTFVNSTTYAPNSFTTAYAWYKICSAVTPTATKSMRVRAVVNTNATTTDWFIDESALVPATLTTDNRGPQQLFLQFSYDRGARWVRP